MRDIVIASTVMFLYHSKVVCSPQFDLFQNMSMHIQTSISFDASKISNTHIATFWKLLLSNYRVTKMRRITTIQSWFADKVFNLSQNSKQHHKCIIPLYINDDCVKIFLKLKINLFEYFWEYWNSRIHQKEVTAIPSPIAVFFEKPYLLHSCWVELVINFSIIISYNLGL